MSAVSSVSTKKCLLGFEMLEKAETSDEKYLYGFQMLEPFQNFCKVLQCWNHSDCLSAPSEILVSREFSREFFNFHFSFSISSHLSFTFNSRKRVKGIYFSLFTSRKKWKLSEFHSFSREKKSEIRCGVWPDLSLSSQILSF